MSITKETLEIMAKKVVDEAYKDKIINKDSEMYLGLVIGIYMFMKEVDKEQGLTSEAVELMLNNSMRGA